MPIDAAIGLFNPLIDLGYGIATGSVLSIPTDVKHILADTALTQKLVDLGFAKTALNKLSGFTGFLSGGIPLYVTDYLINELIGAVSRPFGDLTYEAK